MKNNKDKGIYGENLAAAYLKRQGYRILKKNYRNLIGEIDLIAMDKDTLCFIEVKTRESGDYGPPFEAVTPRKQKQIVKTAQMYLSDEDLDDVAIRFDVLAIELIPSCEPEIELLKHAFETDSY